MDALDVRILRFYISDQTLAPIAGKFRQSLAAIARKVGADEDVVRHRLKRIEDSGFIRDWRLHVNASLWGGGSVNVRFDVEPGTPKADLIKQLRLIPGMTHAAVFYDSIVALLDYDDERVLPRQIELVRRLAGASEVFVARDAFPECRVSLTARDWDLVRALRRNPRRSYTEVAAAVGLSARTAKARLTRLLAAGIGFAWPTLNMRAPLGSVSVQLEVRYPAERKAAIDEAITSHLEPYLWHTLHLLPYRPGDLWPCGYHLFVPNLAVAEEILAWAKRVPGVSHARIHLYEDLINFFDNYDVELDRKLGRMPTAIPTVSVRKMPTVAPRTGPR